MSQPQDGEGVTPAPPGLSPVQSRVLRFERRFWRVPGAKDAAIAEELGMSATRYFQVLNGLLDSPAALAAEPMLVQRLRRVRDARREDATSGTRR